MTAVVLASWAGGAGAQDARSNLVGVVGYACAFADDVELILLRSLADGQVATVGRFSEWSVARIENDYLLRGDTGTILIAGKASLRVTASGSTPGTCNAAYDLLWTVDEAGGSP
jgi:hypothetical protein